MTEFSRSNFENFSKLYPVILGCVSLICLLFAVFSVAAVEAIDVCQTCTHTTLQSAVDAVPEGLSEITTIRVAQGTYEGKTTINSSKKIKIEGGWASGFASRTNDPSLTVLRLSGQAGIVTISAGAGKNIEITIENVKLTGAFSSNYDLGIGLSALANNGGTVILTVNRCLITENTASHGKGIGIGLESYGSGSLITFTMTATSVIRNHVTFYSGGGLYMEAYDLGVINANITNSVIADNSAMYAGGIGVGASYPGCCPSPFPLAGVVNLNIVNTTITNNLAWKYRYYGGGDGGGLALWGGYGNINTNITNSIIWGNSATVSGADIYNEAVDSYSGYGNGSSIVNVSYSDIGTVSNSTGGTYNTGVNVLNADPLFVNSAAGDYHLSADSPLVDAGTSAGAPSDDLDGNGRPFGNGIDIGAYEFIGCTLTVTKAGTGTGTVTSNPAGIDCGGDCSESYASGTSVTLTAAASSGSTFAGWSGDADCSDGVVTMDADKTCTATFALIQRTLTVTKSGTGTGTVTSNPAGIDCGADCSEAYNDGTAVTLTAAASSGSTFAGWRGDCSGTNTTTIVTMDADKTCTAIFSPIGNPIISARPMAVNLGALRVGNTSERTVTIKNTGKSDLVIGDIVIGGINPSEFGIKTNTCPIAIAPLGTCTITVEFKPKKPFGKKSAAMSISSNAPKKPTINVRLLGAASPPKITVAPKSLNFGKLSIPTEKTVTITNKGVSDLEIGDVTIKDSIGNESKEFRIVSNFCDALLKQNESCSITLAFTPTGAIGKKAGVLNISSDDPKKSLVKVRLSGVKDFEPFLSGTAAVGSPIKDAAVTIKDKFGITKEGQTDSNGKYIVNITGLTAPFLLRVSEGENQLYGVAAAAGTANIHPFTDLIIRNWYNANGGDIDTAFDDGTPMPNPPTPAAINTIQGVLKELLTHLLLSEEINPAAFNLITTPFNADKTGFDNVLERIRVDIDDDYVTITQIDPETEQSGDIIGYMPIDANLSTTANLVDNAQNAINAMMTALKNTINNKKCDLAGTDLQPYFESDFLWQGVDIYAMAEQFKELLNCPGSKIDLFSEFVITEVISFDDAKKTLQGRSRLTRASGGMHRIVLDFKYEDDKWVVKGNGEIAEVEVDSEWERHVRASGTSHTKTLRVEASDYMDEVKSATIEGPGITGSMEVTKICDETDSSPMKCSDIDWLEPTLERMFKLELENVFPYSGAIYTVKITKTDNSTVEYKRTILATSGSHETDFPNFSGIATHSIGSVKGKTITASVYTPLWVGEVASPFVNLWNENNEIGYVDAVWVGTPKLGQYNTFKVTIPATYNGQSVTQTVLGQDAQYPGSKGWGKTNVYWYFE